MIDIFAIKERIFLFFISKHCRAASRSYEYKNSILKVFGCYFSLSSRHDKAHKGKIYSSAIDAVSDIPDGAKLLVGGFGMDEEHKSSKCLTYFQI